MKKFRQLRSIGITAETDEDVKKRVMLVNTLSMVIGSLILLIAPPICSILKWPLWITIPITIDIIGNFAALIFNYYKRYLGASLMLYFTQCAAILYFGYMLGELFHLEFMLIFLVSVNYMIVGKKLSRNIGLLSAILTFLVLQARYYFGPSHPIPIAPAASHLIQSLVFAGVLILTVVVNSRFFDSNVDNARLKRANNFIRIFLAQVTHELRTPLDSIHQVSQLLRKEVKKDANLKKIRSLVDIGFTASSHASNIVNNVLDMAQIEGGEAPAVANEPFRIISLMEKIMEVNQVIANREGIMLFLHVDPDMPEAVVGDSLHINQVLTNLLANAIKYGTRKSTVDIAIQRCGEDWQLRVSNLGPGIPREKIESIFDPFFTGRTGQIQGSGLGLYIVKMKVTSMNGKVDVESVPNGLTVFTVTLPLIEATLSDQPAESTPETDTLDLNSVDILVAEDSRLTSFLLSRFLKDMGCSFTMVNNGQELLDTAMRKCPADCPDIIIMDYDMPVLNGEETILQIKQTPQLSHIPIIVTTGDISTDTLNKMLAAGADTFLKKPIDHLILQKKIRELYPASLRLT